MNRKHPSIKIDFRAQCNLKMTFLGKTLHYDFFLFLLPIHFDKHGVNFDTRNTIFFYSEIYNEIETGNCIDENFYQENLHETWTLGSRSIQNRWRIYAVSIFAILEILHLSIASFPVYKASTVLDNYWKTSWKCIIDKFETWFLNIYQYFNH